MAQHNNLKRLQHSASSFDHRSTLPNDERMRESNSYTKFTRPLGPGPRHAKRGGSGKSLDRNWHSSLPKRTIYYDLAESFMDHSTNPLSSDLYSVRFKHSTKRWPGGRFLHYKEKLNKLDGTIINITCTRNISIIPKRKKKEENAQNITNTTASVLVANPNAKEQKKIKANEQDSFYTDFFGKPKLSSTTPIQKTNGINNSTKSSTVDSLTAENKEDHQC